MEDKKLAKIHKAYKKLNKAKILSSLQDRDDETVDWIVEKDSDGNVIDDYEITYSDIWKYCLGINFDNRTLQINDHETIRFDEILSAYCILENVSYIQKPLQNQPIRIKNIRIFYIKDYFVEVMNSHNENRRIPYQITQLLYNIGLIEESKKHSHKLYTIKNEYQMLQMFEAAHIPKDLFYPMKQLNHILFNDDYRIDKFRVESTIKIVP